MRFLKASGNVSRKAVLDKENLISNGFVSARVKNLPSSSKLMTKITRQDSVSTTDEDYGGSSSEKREGILQLSKKIQKFNQTTLFSKPFLKVSNKETSNTSSTQAKTKKIFVEDGIKKTTNYVALSYKSHIAKNVYKFLCFHDRDLGVPSTYSEKIVEHSFDNDCPTDEEQVRGAIKSLFKSLQEKIKEENKEISEGAN